MSTVVKAIPSGVILGDTDTQNVSNKTLDGSNNILNYTAPFEPFNRMFVNTATALTANTAYFNRFRFPNNRPIDTVYYYMGAVTSGNIDIGLYTSSDGGVTLTRVVSTGSIAAGAINGVRSAALAITPNMNIDYWAGVAMDNGTVQLGRSNIVQTGIWLLENSRLSKASSFPLPASITGLSESGAAQWLAFGE